MHIKQKALALRSLSVYRGLLKKPVVSALLRLLTQWDTADEFEIVTAWSNYFAALCQTGHSMSSRACIAQLIQYDDNVFSRAAMFGKMDELPLNIIDAAQRDIQVLLEAAGIQPGDLLGNMTGTDAFIQTLHGLPKWISGDHPQNFDGSIDQTMAGLQAFHQMNGCGLFAKFHAFLFDGEKLAPIAYPDPIRLTDLKEYTVQRDMVVNNTIAFIQGHTANNVLLYGDRGTGKSSTVKALINEFGGRNLRMIECPKQSLQAFGKLTQMIANEPNRFILFIDDLSFSDDDPAFAPLKASLEGGLASRPDNALIYATSNRRHLVKETFKSRAGDELHFSDTMQESMSLSDRFGLCVTFSSPDRKKYLAIVQSIARQRSINVDLNELQSGAERWALERGGRSPRVARQYVDMIEGRILSKLPIGE